MGIKRIFGQLALVLILAGCASYVTVNSDCNVPSRPFADVVACINKASAGSTDDYMTMYTLRANQLLQQYQAGKLTETDARVKLQEQFLALRQQHMSSVAAVSAMTARPTNCTTRGKNTTCY